MPVLDDIVAGVRLDLARRQATTPLEELRALLAREDEDGIAGFVQQLLDAAQVRPGRRAAAAAALCAQRLVNREYAQIWLVRAAPGSGFLRQAWAAGLGRVAV